MSNEGICLILKTARLARGMGQGQLARLSGRSPSYIQRIEKGDRYPSAETIRKLAVPLGFEEAELLVLAGHLSALPVGPPKRGLDPYVTALLAQEPVQVQRALITLVVVLKSFAKALTAEGNNNQG